MTENSKAADRSIQDMKEKLTMAAELLQLAILPLVKFATFVLPYFLKFCSASYAFYVHLPIDYVTVLIGLVFCFFGGLYPTLFAALMAAEFGGRKVVVAALKDLAGEATKILEASKKDDDADADTDGKKDVKQITGKELLVRKMKLVMIKMNPEKVDKAITSIYKVWLSVAAVLTLQFARTISLALTISDCIKKAVNRYCTPTIQVLVPDEYDKWVPIIVGWLTKGIGVSIAWYIQSVISAFTSALEGGLIVSRTLMRIGRKRGFNFIPPENETVIDEISSYVIAGLGFFFQVRLGFQVPYPLNLILWPFGLAETWIRWSITKVA